MQHHLRRGKLHVIGVAAGVGELRELQHEAEEVVRHAEALGGRMPARRSVAQLQNVWAAPWLRLAATGR